MGLCDRQRRRRSGRDSSSTESEPDILEIQERESKDDTIDGWLHVAKSDMETRWWAGMGTGHMYSPAYSVSLRPTGQLVYGQF